MTEVPEFWRTEIWHPLSVHFPIALLIIALVFKGISIKSSNLLWQEGGGVLLLFGVITAWISVYTGEQADAVVVRSLCDPTVLEDHENTAYALSWIFTTALILDAAYWKNLLNVKKPWLKFVIFFIMLVGAGFLIYTGHQGAELVYQQGAGVYHPSEDCTGF